MTIQVSARAEEVRDATQFRAFSVALDSAMPATLEHVTAAFRRGYRDEYAGQRWGEVSWGSLTADDYAQGRAAARAQIKRDHERHLCRSEAQSAEAQSFQSGIGNAAVANFLF
jgi:hypothetical protein